MLDLVGLDMSEQPPGEVWSAAHYAAAHDRLIAARASAAALIAALARDHADIVQATASTATDDEHDPEGATIAFERERTAASLTGARHRLAELDQALDRLAEGGYGICVVCRRPIAAARLAARPTATTCIVCARPPRLA